VNRIRVTTMSLNIVIMASEIYLICRA